MLPMNNFGSLPLKDDPHQVWLKSAHQFWRRRWKCKKFYGQRTKSDGNGSKTSSICISPKQIWIASYREHVLTGWRLAAGNVGVLASSPSNSTESSTCCAVVTLWVILRTLKWELISNVQYVETFWGGHDMNACVLGRFQWEFIPWNQNMIFHII